jgi:hypothetical protein
MRTRLLTAASLLAFGALGFGVGVLAVAANGVAGPSTAVVSAAAFAPVHAWRVGLSSVPDAFDFEQFADDTDRSMRLVQHATAAVLGVLAGAFAGALLGRVLASVGFSEAWGMLPAFAVSWAVGQNAFVSFNDEYRPS